MFKLNEFQYRANRLSDHLPWALLVAPSVVQQKTGVLQRTLTFRGQDLISTTIIEQQHIASMLNSALMTLGGGFVMHVEAARHQASDVIELHTGNPCVDLIEHIRAINFGGQALFETRYYLTLTYYPKHQRQKKWFDRIAAIFGGLFSEGSEDQGDGDSAEILDQFCRKTDQFVLMCQTVFDEAYFLEDDELLTYLHSTISTKSHPVTTPEVPMYLDDVLVDTPVSVGVEMYLGQAYVQIISIKGYPSFTHPGLLDELDAQGFCYRLVHRFMGLDVMESRATLGHYERMLFGQQNRLTNTKGDAGLKDRAAMAGADAVGQTLQWVEEDAICMGLHTCVLVVWDDHKDVCIKRAQHIEGIFNRAGFVTSIERPNIFPAWLSSLPGHVYTNVRQALISSENMAHMMPLQASWAGDAISTHLGEAPHMYCVTDGATPYRLNLNDQDVGHTMILGPNGSGKSVLLVMLALCFMKYDQAQVFIFDKGRSSRCATLAVGGQYLELSSTDDAMRFQPLKDVHQPGERTFAFEWLEQLFHTQGLELTDQQRDRLRTGLNALASTPKTMRTLSTLRQQLQDNTLKQALKAFCKGGIYGKLWDNNTEDLDLGNWVSMEMERLMESSPKQVALCLMYLFQRLEARFDGRPTLLILDEAWVFLQDPVFQKRIAQWLRVLRKKRVYVVFATQNITDALESNIAPTLLSNCPTRILLPCAAAKTPAMRPYYEKLGLNDSQIQLVAQARAKRQYYFNNPNKGSRLFELGLSELEIAIAGASSPDDHKRIDQALDEARGTSFLYHYLKLTGFEHYTA